MGIEFDNSSLVDEIRDDSSRQELIRAIERHKAVLIAGAGSSASVGYPLWPDLVEKIRLRFAPRLNQLNLTLPEFANQIVEGITSRDLESYFNLLRNTFEPGDREPFESFHLSLVQLPFCGIATTNYDGVLEAAVVEAFSGDHGFYNCESVDLCDDDPNLVFRFLRGLSEICPPRQILHLHGFYKKPRKMIVTASDYAQRYGEIPSYDESGNPLNRSLDILHKRVLWTLLATHTIVFVGFSLEDPFFNYVLDVVGRDFELGNDPEHFALVGVASKKELDQARQYLSRYNTQPVFYLAPRNSFDGTVDHRELGSLIFDLGKSFSIPSPVTTVSDVTRRLLKL